ncbi:phage terminase large subunit [Klebsiella quasivariicola]|uniref:phage terminase large subunit n=1 Tax=Klebsiella quasivariicola TaxID=2026240 RepID=UPI0024791E66|nr:phage terminase large subunit [Klebsiella quasivariicola]
MALTEWDDLTLPQRVILKKKSTKSFLNFTRIWFELLQGDQLRVNWHHRLTASKIDSLIAGTLPERNLIINTPPGSTKTEFFSIHLPPYVNALVQAKKLQRFRNLNISFSDSLVQRNSRRTRDIIASPEYQELWPCDFGVKQANEWEIINELGRSIGQTVSRAGGGQITGGRGGYPGEEFSGFVLLDDFNKPLDMFSETKRATANQLLVNTIRSRRGDRSKDHPTPIISIQQRLHVEDATGFMLAGGMGLKFDHVVIPAMIGEEYIDALPEPWRSQCWAVVKDTDSVTVAGVRYWSYWPDMEYVGDLMALWERDEYTFLSQYQQKPEALSGGLISGGWFRTYTKLPKLLWRAIYVDTNSGKVTDYNDYTVFTLAGMGADGNLYIIDMERGKWDPQELLEKAEELCARWKPSDKKNRTVLRYMAIEDKQAGQGLITTLKKKNLIPIKAVQRGDGENKLVRCLNTIPQLKTGKVFIPDTHDANRNPVFHTYYNDGETIAGSTLWVLGFVAEAVAFTPDDTHDHDDMLDTVMDAVDDALISGNNPLSISKEALRRR